MNDLQAVEQLLFDTIGMDVASIGSSSIERAVQTRMRATGVTTVSEYYRVATADRAELQELVECVVVPETWFFRGPETFAAMIEESRRLGAFGPGRQLRVLSVPSSTGEEPYTIVMALLDAGYAPGSIVVDAIDVSVRALERAGRAVYGANSFRSADLSFRDRYFEQQGREWKLSSRVTSLVRFRRRSVVDTGFLAEESAYHFIFCRNLLIYFDRETQSRVIDRLTDLLAPGGLLILGAGESMAVTDKPFTNAGYAMAFAYRKEARSTQAAADPVRTRKPKEKAQRGTASERGMDSSGVEGAVTGRPPFGATYPPKAPVSLRAQRERAARLGTTGDPGAALPPTGSQKSTARTGAAHSSPTAPPTVASHETLATARKLADAGRLTEAAHMCESAIAANGATADALYLLGIIRDAQSDTHGAMEAYRKTLFLAPDHADAMLHLALIREKQGEMQQAATLRARARRVHSSEAGGK